MKNIIPVYFAFSFSSFMFAYGSKTLDPLMSWRRHEMEAFFAYLVHCARNSPLNSPYKGQRRRPLMFSLIYAWTNDWVKYRDIGGLRRHRANYGVTVMNALCRWYSLNFYHIICHLGHTILNLQVQEKKLRSLPCAVSDWNTNCYCR